MDEVFLRERKIDELDNILKRGNLAICKHSSFLIIDEIVFNRMIENIYIRGLSNDMKIVVQKNYLGVKFCTEVWTVLNKTTSSEIYKSFKA